MATVWNTDYIIDIIHRLHNAYVQALAYSSCGSVVEH